MSKIEVKLVTSLTFLGIIASYAGNNSLIEKAGLIGGPLIAWVCLRLLIRSIRR